MSKAPYRLTPLAQQDLEEIWLYTAKTWSVEQADIYYQLLIETIKKIADKRSIPQVSDIFGYLKYRVGSHVIFFKKTNKQIDVIRILHKNMDIQRHL